jgi:hypothetical protein
MSPLILDGYTVAVDTSSTSRDGLVGKIVVAWNPKENALLLSRLISFDRVGRVLWWAGRDDTP